MTLLLIDTAGAAPFAVRAFPHCTWREVLPIFVAAAIAIPFGTMALIVVDPTVLRWFMALLVLSLLGILMSGWRYHGRPTLAGDHGGRPVFRIWRRRGADRGARRHHLLARHRQQRGDGARQSTGLFPAVGCDAVRRLRLAGPAHRGFAGALGPARNSVFRRDGVGAYFFAGTSDLLYRRIAYIIIAAAALISLPLLDTWLR